MRRKEQDKNRSPGLAYFGLQVADHIPAMLAYWDRDLICRFANAAYVDWFGKTRQELVDKLTIKQLLGDELYQKNLRYIAGALLGKKQVFEREIKTPSGEIRHSLATYVPDIEEGQVKGFFVHVGDVTPVKKLENELVKKGRVINEQNKRLLNFANTVSHNLRSYAGNLASLLELYEKGTDLDRAMVIKHLGSLSKSFLDTIKGLSDVVVLQNSTEISTEPVVLYDYVEKAIVILQQEINVAGAKVANTIDRTYRVLLNPAYLESVLVNLLSNAIKYRHPERIPFIRVSASVSKDTISLAVSDNGLGIDLARHKENIFGLYKTFHQNPESKGLGLYITKYQVEAMGGTIDVESQPDVGTTFTIVLPGG